MYWIVKQPYMREPKNAGSTMEAPMMNRHAPSSDKKDLTMPSSPVFILM